MDNTQLGDSYFRCEPFRATIRLVDCAKRHQLANTEYLAKTSQDHTQFMRDSACRNCAVGKKHLSLYTPQKKERVARPTKNHFETERTCPDCGKPYLPTGTRQVRCAPCRKNLRKKSRRKKKMCYMCNTPFSPTGNCHVRCARCRKKRKDTFVKRTLSDSGRTLDPSLH